MKKIMFNDTFSLTQAVIDGKKTMTRRLVKQPTYKNFTIGFPTPDIAFDDKHPLAGAFCWINKDNRAEYTDWIRPQWRVGEVVAIAQSYKTIFDEATESGYWDDKYADFRNAITHNHAGWDNKMFVRSDLMPHQIQITDIRLQQLQDISDDDCLKEGVIMRPHLVGEATLNKYYPSAEHLLSIHKCGWGICYDTPQLAFSELIDKVSGADVWKTNPYVFVYEFRLVK